MHNISSTHLYYFINFNTPIKVLYAVNRIYTILHNVCNVPSLVQFGYINSYIYLYTLCLTSANRWQDIKEVQYQKLFVGQYRLLLRREQVLKLACNQWLTPDLKFQPMHTSETAWCWGGQDFSDNEAKLEQLAVKFQVKVL